MIHGFNENNRYVSEGGHIPSGCAVGGFIDRTGKRISGSMVVDIMAAMRERSTDLGSGYAGYGIYPALKDFYAFHIMYATTAAQAATEDLLRAKFDIEREEVIPTRQTKAIKDAPLLRRYFVRPTKFAMAERRIETEDEFVRQMIMHINADVDGAFVFSSGKNMGVFKGVGFPEDIAEFFRVEEYDAYCWIAHGRFPTNTPGWWGGAHPFSMLNWSIVHNGEISSYGINKRYLEQFGYRCTLLTDTEVMAYMVDLLIRVHGLPPYLAAKVMAPPFWNEIDRMEGQQRENYEKLRMIYGSALVNGPFGIICGYGRGMFGLNDRIKLRPMIAAEKGDMIYIASEESAIRTICAQPDRVWNPRGGEPVIAELYEGVAV
jgi:glutamate synthase domain-containing protein 1